MKNNWTPSINLDLIDIINTHTIKGLRVGSPESYICKIMGTAELPVTKLNKKSKIFNHLYGNVTLLSENGCVIAISIDFNSKRTEMVAFGEIGSWGLDDWMQLAEKERWLTINSGDVIQLIGNGIIISLSQKGQLGLLSLKE